MACVDLLFSKKKRKKKAVISHRKMVEGFVGPCMLGAMGIIFVAFLAPSGNCIMIHAPACGALLRLRAHVVRPLQMNCVVCVRTAGAVVTVVAAGN
jgi:CDP-diglyceride synthetase